MKHHRQTTRRPLIAGVAALLSFGTLSVCALSSTSVAAPAQSLVTYGEPTYPTSTADLPKEVRDAASDAAALVDANKTDLLGSYVDKSSGEVAIVPSTDRGAEMATAQEAKSSVLRVDQRASASVADVSTLGDGLRALSPTLAKSIYEWEPAPESGGINVSARLELSDSDKALLDEFASKRNVPVRVSMNVGAELPTLDEDRSNDPSPYAGGARFGIANDWQSSAVILGECSTGVPYLIGTTNYMLTAGHCFERDTLNHWAWTYSGTNNAPSKQQYMGNSFWSTFHSVYGTVAMGADNDNHGDIAMINVSPANAAGDHIWWGTQTTPDRIPITSRKAPTVGDPTCINGAESGSDCGTVITATNITWTANDGTIIRNGDRAHSAYTYDCSIDGDSGGTVLYDHTGAETSAQVIGIISGSARPGSGCDQYFTGIEEANQAWNGEVNFY
jgi:hypothetical protein